MRDRGEILIFIAPYIVCVMGAGPPCSNYLVVVKLPLRSQGPISQHPPPASSDPLFRHLNPLSNLLTFFGSPRTPDPHSCSVRTPKSEGTYAQCGRKRRIDAQATAAHVPLALLCATPCCISHDDPMTNRLLPRFRYVSTLIKETIQRQLFRRASASCLTARLRCSVCSAPLIMQLPAAARRTILPAVSSPSFSASLNCPVKLLQPQLPCQIAPASIALSNCSSLNCPVN